MTGSQQFLLNEKISQSLSGRTAILRLLPFSLAELAGFTPQGFWARKPLRKSKPPVDLFEILFKGFYPRIHDRKLEPNQWYRDYFDTYITKDIRTMLNIGDLRTFEQFIRLLAGRSGQLLNLTSLGNDSGISHTTARRWLSILEASYIVSLLPPHFKNFHKRLIKNPKVYFLDPGLLCYLLRITSPKELPTHPQLGGIFEALIVSEFYKWFTNQGKEAPLYFWRDKSGHEVDLLIDRGTDLYPIEIKASRTIAIPLFKSLKYWLDLSKSKNGALVFGGNLFQKRGEIQTIPWFAVS